MSDHQERLSIPRSEGRWSVLAGILAFMVSSSGTIATATAAPSAGSSATEVSSDGKAPSRALRVRVEQSIEDAPLIPAWVADRNPRLAEMLRDAEGHELWLEVEIVGATYEYGVSVVAMRDGKPVGMAGPSRCECTNEDLLAVVDEEIAAMVEVLRPGTAEQSVANTKDDHHKARAPGDSALEGRSSVDRRRLGILGYSGIGIGALGVGLMASGIPLALRQDRIRGGPGEVMTRSTHNAGIGLAVAGGMALAAGAALFVVELVRPGVRSIAVTPTMGHRQAGMSFTLAF
jgi:hypothetical protein